ncbi:hypothetical protein LQZ24_03775 [Fructobacillus sp. M1-13]|uniref:Uncharacterized protein n=1 Tax=Fructobacillus papyriferae TaxID=2713171 RepID=A0ABS5QTB7_9LACO|nr:hypothetical protein [Fructobacillus papyriferae]MBS9335187.1 hypothetical protein [Fructobacillus papyriferae]MCD2159144.1 hypothetical protein [Fructobacillus papyriferae]
MAQVKIDWVDWVKKSSKKQLWALALGPAVLILILFFWRVFSGNSQYDANWFAYALSIYYALAFSPAGEQIQYRLFPKAIPHNQYQVTSWTQWAQALMSAVVLLILALLFFPPKNQSEIAVHVIASVVLGFVAMWAWRWYKGIRSQKATK